MPSRIVREGILTSEAVAALSLEAELFYRCLMSVVDDYGRYEDNAALLRARCFPLKLDAWSVELVDKCLAEVSQVKDGRPALVQRYRVGGKNYLQINNFNQKTRSAAKFPAPPALQLVDRRPTDDLQTQGTCARYSESEALVVDEGVVGDGDFRLDDAVAQFREKYQTFNPQGLQSPKVETAYADIVFSMTHPREEHRLVLEGLERMVRAGPKHRLGAVNFILDRRYRDPWELEVEAMKGPRSAEQMMKEMGI